MRHRTVVKAKTLFRLAEIAADDVGKFFQFDLGGRIERIDVVHRDHTARHVPFMIPHSLIVFLDIRIGPVAGAKGLDI